jgi:hypothetical protein
MPETAGRRMPSKIVAKLEPQGVKQVTDQTLIAWIVGTSVALLFLVNSTGRQRRGLVQGDFLGRDVPEHVLSRGITVCLPPNSRKGPASHSPDAGFFVGAARPLFAQRVLTIMGLNA